MKGSLQRLSQEKRKYDKGQKKKDNKNKYCKKTPFS